MPPKKASQKGSSLQELLSNLTMLVENEEHESVVAVADKLLAQNPSDKKTFKTKIIALIKADKYSTALSELAKNTVVTNDELTLERAYCLYRVGKLEDANGLIDQALSSQQLGAADSRGLKHLKAQIVRIAMI